MDANEEKICALELKLTKFEAQTEAADKALMIAREGFEAWKANANEWRQTLNDQRSMYVSRSEVIAIVMAATVLLGLVLKYTK